MPRKLTLDEAYAASSHISATHRPRLFTAPGEIDIYYTRLIHNLDAVVTLWEELEWMCVSDPGELMVRVFKVGRHDLMWRVIKCVAQKYPGLLFRFCDEYADHPDTPGYLPLIQAFLGRISIPLCADLGTPMFRQIPDIVRMFKGPVKVSNPVLQGMIDSIPRTIRAPNAALKYLPRHLYDFVDRINDDCDLWFGESRAR